MKNQFILAFALLLLLTTYNTQKKFTTSSKTNIKEVIIENNFILEEKKIEEKIKFLYSKNLISFKSKELEKRLIEIDLIESFEIKKIFPDKIKIKIFEKKPIAIIQNKKDKKYYTSKGEIINYSNLKEFRNLPYVFGDAKNFKILYNNLKRINFPIDEIQKFYLFESLRWDLVTYDNKTIRLPIKGYLSSLKNFLKLKEQENFNKYKSFDYRINNQLILK